MSHVNWEKIRNEYIDSNGQVKLKDLALKYGVKPGTLRSRKNRENWDTQLENVATDNATQRKNVATSKNQKQPHDKRKSYKICGAKNRRGEPCKRPAGWGTDHPGEGRCKLHGGCSPGPPKGNKNAVTTGEHETIWMDTLDDEERVLFDKIKTDVLKQLDEEIKLMTIRERRMMQRIQRLRQVDFTVVKIKQGTEKGEETDIQESEGTLGQIQAIEEALTRVQEKKAKLLDLKHKIETGADEDDGSLAELARAIRESKLRAGDG